jgi:putative DNA primase/helicase
MVQIEAQMERAGIEEPPADIIPDGHIHRFGRKGSSWYVVHPDPIAPTWSFGDWRLSIKEHGEGNPGRTLTPKEIRDRKQRLHDLQIKIAAEKARFEAGAAMSAEERWERYPSAPPNHPYLKAKGVPPCGVRIDGRALLVPMRDVEGKLWSLQEIYPDGRKQNQEGGRRRGCFFQIGEIGDLFIIGEGFSTCATFHMATGYAVISAGEAGNVETVSSILRRAYPAATIIVCGDDDWRTAVRGKPHNTGKLAATAAAKAIDGVLVMPWFNPSSRPRWATDFNDMAKLHGLDEVATCIRLALVAHQERSASNALFRALIRLRGMLDAGELDIAAVSHTVNRLHEAAQHAGLSVNEIERTIASAAQSATRAHR